MNEKAEAARLIQALVSKRCGLVTDLSPQHRGPDEPCPPHLWNATLTHYNFMNTPLGMRLTGGKGLTEEQAKLAALGEAMERYAAFHWDNQRIRIGPPSANAITADDCVPYSPAQYAAGAPHQPCSPEQHLSWIAGTQLPDRTPVETPAALTYLLAPLPRAEDRFAAVNSNGLSAGRDQTHAILGGAYEVIERDAFMITWLNRLPATTIKTPDRGCQAARIISHYAQFGVTVRLLSLATDQAATIIMAVAENPDDEMAPRVVGLGCDVDPVAAVDKAAAELCQLRSGVPGRVMAGDYRARLTGYDAVRSVDDHMLFHLMPEQAAEFDFLTATGAECELGDLPRPDCQTDDHALDLLVASVTRCGARIAFTDITPPDIAALGPRVVRVFITGFQPIHFGAGQARLGGARLFTAPVDWGLRSAPLSEADLNPCPHPLA